MKSIHYALCFCLLLSNQIFAQPSQPPAPLTCNGGNCTAPTSETCPPGGSTIVTNFTGATLRSGSPSSLPAVYSFYNVATVSGQQINVTITIDAQSNCDMTGAEFSIDDDGATDQSGNSIASFFAPRITADNTLTTADRRGYVQFTIRFFIGNGTAGEQWPADYTTVPSLGGLLGLNYIHYDIDGSTVGTNGWFRETGVVQNVPGSVINGDVSTELAVYNYTDGLNWRGFAGSVCERSSVSRCAQVTAAASYATAQTQITVRMGYDYHYTNSNFNSRPTRQYGSRFGCFSFPQQSSLPVKLISFTGTYKSNAAFLNWEAENQVNFSGYEIEKSTDGIHFEGIASKSRQGTGSDREFYNYMDDLSAATEKAFFYRLKMVDLDGKFTYSNIIVLRKDGIKTGISISPNPVVSGGLATARIEASKKGTIEIEILDMAGRIVLRQQNQVFEGTNSIALNQLSRLQPGIYILRAKNGEEVVTERLSIAR